MRPANPSLRPPTSSFPNAKQSRALDDEDAFMHAHGGRGTRCLYAIGEFLARPFARRTAPRKAAARRKYAAT